MTDSNPHPAAVPGAPDLVRATDSRPTSLFAPPLAGARLHIGREAAPVDWVPPACTLPTAEQPLREAEFDALLTGAHAINRVGGTRLDVTIHAAAEAAARALARRETACCSFFRFEFDVEGTDVVMRIRVPATYAEVLNAFESRGTS